MAALIKKHNEARGVTSGAALNKASDLRPTVDLGTSGGHAGEIPR